MASTIFPNIGDVITVPKKNKLKLKLFINEREKKKNIYLCCKAAAVDEKSYFLIK